MPCGLALAVAAAALAAAADATPAPSIQGTAALADGPTVDAVGACPQAGEVRRLLSGLVSAAEAHAAPVSIQDRGPRVRIAVRGSATTLDDPGRDCAGRARMAATVAAAALQNPKVVFGPPVWTIEKGLVFDVASSAGTAVWAPGAEFRVAYGPRAWSLVGAAGARAPAELLLDNGWRAELLRFPLDAGARLTGYFGRFRPWLVLGGSATITGIVGHELVQTDREWRLDIGALVMAGATLRVTGRLGVAAALNVRWQPRTYRLQVTPTGQIGETPAWWFGLSLNYTLDGKGSSPP